MLQAAEADEKPGQKARAFNLSSCFYRMTAKVTTAA